MRIILFGLFKDLITAMSVKKALFQQDINPKTIEIIPLVPPDEEQAQHGPAALAAPAQAPTENLPDHRLGLLTWLFAGDQPAEDTLPEPENSQVMLKVQAEGNEVIRVINLMNSHNVLEIKRRLAQGQRPQAAPPKAA